ncbi:hypothetical protein KDH_78570 [Dictyobacter sp. S3.2.2.5]|uniref:Uncharacterized protein n=1 Tax=Dictyobacter halimunensis TaxID=3026934 RepID=A0ABQ6G5D5_9CHLR|nr:hypothetical protein KDH_78570 [Dictyobacter sp. S3.2.2.5]
MQTGAAHKKDTLEPGELYMRDKEEIKEAGQINKRPQRAK